MGCGGDDAIGGTASTVLHGHDFLTSPPVNTAGLSSVFLEYFRWLDSAFTPYMTNIVQVFNGTSWVTIFQTGGAPGVQDKSWQKITHDVTAYRNTALRVRFGFRINSVDASAVSSWNIDEVRIGVAPSCRN